MHASNLIYRGGLRPLKAAQSSNRIRAFSQPFFAQSARLRSTLSKIWVPTGGVTATEGESMKQFAYQFWSHVELIAR